jgi:hypothetical protein
MLDDLGNPGGREASGVFRCGHRSDRRPKELRQAFLAGLVSGMF